MPPRPIRHFTKPAIDFTQQLQKLQARGLVVADESRALRYLANISYYRLSGGYFFCKAKIRFFARKVNYQLPLWPA